MQNNRDEPNRYNLPTRKGSRIEPLNSEGESKNAAADLIRQKIKHLYEEEPAAKEEQEISDAVPQGKRSKHQAYMHELSTSGKSLGEIQTAWHEYYQNLSDEEKHEVWQEFYQQHRKNEAYHPHTTSREIQSQPSQQPDSAKVTHAPAQTTPRQTEQESSDSVTDVKQRILDKVSSRGSKRSANMKSLLFGLGMGGLMLLVTAFGFFNERFIAPFISPSTVMSSTPLIVDEGGPVGEDPRIIIPKINVEIPVVYGEESIAEDDVQKALEDGVLHYPITPEPGEVGNSVIFGHSSNNLLNRGDYKFAFVLLNQLEEGDTFMLEKDGVRYVYRVFDKEVVPPTDLSVLNPHDEKESIVTLITCDPPGTSINRLAVRGEQISPDPAQNEESSQAPSESSQPVELPSDSPTLWDRVRGN